MTVLPHLHGRHGADVELIGPRIGARFEADMREWALPVALRVYPSTRTLVFSVLCFSVVVWTR